MERARADSGRGDLIADPEGTEEDDGVLMTVVLDGVRGDSDLLVLEAKTMREVGRANVGSVVGFGFHGTHVPDAVGKPVERL